MFLHCCIRDGILISCHGNWLVRLDYLMAHLNFCCLAVSCNIFFLPGACKASDRFLGDYIFTVLLISKWPLNSFVIHFYTDWHECRWYGFGGVKVIVRFSRQCFRLTAAVNRYNSAIMWLTSLNVAFIVFKKRWMEHCTLQQNLS